MPTSVWAPICDPWTIARCPTVTSSPITVGNPGSACTTAPSWMFARSPTRIDSVSPRITAENQMLACSPTATSPTTTAPRATKAEGATIVG